MTEFEIDSYADWCQFVSSKQDFVPKAVSPVVFESWKRCCDHIDPFSSGFQSVSLEELTRRKSRKAELCSVATPYINNLYEVIKGSGSLIILSDEDGVIIDLAADPASHSIKNFPEVGTVQTESIAGTNGVGTALVCKSMVQIRGAEHWLKDNHSWTCNAAPIITNNQIIGCLNLSSPSRRQNSLSMGLITSAVNAITRELELSGTLKEIKFLTQQQNAILKLMESGVIIITGSGKILQANERAHEVLQDQRTWNGMAVSDILSCNISFEEIFSCQKMLDAREISIKVHNKHAHLHISTELIKTGESSEAMAIMLHESKKMMRMANKIVGSTAHFTFSDIICTSPKMRDCIFLAKQAASNDANVLIMGESGTGKELIAQSIHNGSKRRDQPFIAVNCGALSRELIHSELFGYEGGAFTGAKANGNPGKFELADGGTIFLDEIGELPLESQVALLRVIQTNEFSRIGSAETKTINVRVVTATNKDLAACVRDMTFRKDLFFRINIFTIKLPPLRDRREDIRLLIEAFLNRNRPRLNKPDLAIDDESLDHLESYFWPGNVRELENVIERAATICMNDTITLADLPSEITLRKEVIQHSTVQIYENDPVISSGFPFSYTGIDQINREYLKRQLTEVGGNIRELSSRLNISRSTIYRKIQRYNLNPDEFRCR